MTTIHEYGEVHLELLEEVHMNNELLGDLLGEIRNARDCMGENMKNVYILVTTAVATYGMCSIIRDIARLIKG